MSPAVARGDVYMGFPERFDRYYTDPSWKPSLTLYVSPDGSGDGATRETPMAVADAVAAARPGTEILFLNGAYSGCFEFTKENGGTYEEPVVLHAERNADGSIGVEIACCGTGRRTCFNFEGADYVAVDGFEFAGGAYGVRAVGGGYPASEHSRGIAVLNCNGHGQGRDPFFSAQSDWNVWESNVASGAKEEDGHGLYISNGSDWNLVRFNETYGNASSDFQINADPASTCAEVGISFDDPRCDAYAGEGEGGQGASDYFLVEGNYFHDSIVGPNFTSVRRSVVRNNIFGPQMRHNVSFWQETDNPKLGSSDNKILHNLFITRGRHAVQFANGSTRNDFANNLLIGISTDGDQPAANPKAGPYGGRRHRGRQRLSRERLCLGAYRGPGVQRPGVGPNEFLPGLVRELPDWARSRCECLCAHRWGAVSRSRRIRPRCASRPKRCHEIRQSHAGPKRGTVTCAVRLRTF